MRLALILVLPWLPPLAAMPPPASAAHRLLLPGQPCPAGFREVISPVWGRMAVPANAPDPQPPHPIIQLDPELFRCAGPLHLSSPPGPRAAGSTLRPPRPTAAGPNATAVRVPGAGAKLTGRAHRNEPAPD